MISKSKNLIALFATLFLLLLVIQGYFMYKTYQVKEREIYRDVHKRLTEYTDRLEDKGGMRKSPDDSIQAILVRFKNKEITKNEFLNLFDKNRIDTEKAFSKFVDGQFKNEGYEVAVKIEYSSIIFNPTRTNLIKKPIVIYETEKKVKKAGILNTGTWETTSKSTNTDDKTLTRNDSFSLKSTTGYEILNIKSVVFRELTLLFLCCIALLASVLLLYIFTIKNLIKQQKQIEVLHTIVDNISHEFKTPIATLKIASKTLKKNLNQDIIPLIDRQIVRLENLLHQLHKEENTDEMTSIQPEDWNFFIQDLSFTYPKNTFELQSNIIKELPFDKNLMETIIKNLCENCVKYGASKIDIHIKSVERNLEITISDNGEGIAKKELKNIFEKFYRIQSNNIHNTKGLGLGLYFVQKIVTKYQGKIDLKSEINTGTTFKITLPYEY
ncbi:K+-sensing histidine kinase KdpD [Chryseobacterium ginsenosidimutans]|uniref:sensor histidine kinase n=1 Tax=Chryseobacterium ginsenosidimutans TaxID=687846 RepID=UPI002788DD0C|nr:HAMP domain-containing sensor histidine kinase [Chryseobacterium ginsenosidimutans]MDQ0593628.1 K+-sensing histidine kinase KdpD [Chryseobacterium ginsenosidimutans]